MTSFTEKIRAQLNSNCIVHGDLAKGDCVVHVENTPPDSISVDFDHPNNPLGTKSTRCDFLYVAEQGDWVFVVLLELSTYPDKDVGSVFKQLRAGAAYAETQIASHTKICFSSLFVSRGLRRKHRMQLRNSKRKLKFHNHSSRVLLAQCGCYLWKIIEFDQS